MTNLTRKFIIPILAILTLSCQAVSLLKQVEVPFEENIGEFPTKQLLDSTHSLEPPLTATPTRTATPTPFPTVSPTVTITPSPLQMRVFDELWQIVRDEYLYPDFNGLDWDAIYIEYSNLIGSGLYLEDFHQKMDEMISRLGDDHSFFLSPNQVAEEEAQFTGRQDYVGVGVLISAIPDKEKAMILVTIPDGPADQAGLQTRDSIIAVDDKPILDRDGFLRDLIRGPEGSNVTLTVQSPGHEARQVTLTRQRISGYIPVPYQVLTSPSGKRIGYFFMVTFADYSVDGQIRDALRDMNANNPIDGLILDNRFNQGGIHTVLQGSLSYFTSGKLGYFISRFEERPFSVEEQNINGSQEIPLVVLIGADTASYGEVFAGVLKDTQRAYLIGEQTSRNIETLWAYDFEDGSRAWIAHETFRPFHNPQEDWESTGITPHHIIRSDWSEVTIDGDAAIQSALDYLDLSE